MAFYFSKYSYLTYFKYKPIKINIKINININININIPYKIMGT
jgi:hypothetical protein